MSYYGEKGKFSFRDNFCEETDISEMGELANFGKIIGNIFRRIAVGTDILSRNPELSVLIGGIAKGGADIFVINEPVPVFRYGIKLSECDCGIYICGEEKLRFIFFDRYGINMSESIMLKIYNAKSAENLKKSGKISYLYNMSLLYINSIRDSVAENFIGRAVISCGNRKIADIWRNFFSSETGDIVFQISEDGSRVNCYSTDSGFISYERLVLAYAFVLWEKGEKVILPYGFHYAGEELAESMNARYEYSNESNHNDLYKQRFTFDSLFLCTALMNSIENIQDTIRKIPPFYTARREISTDFCMRDSERTILDSDGRIKISRSGKNRISLAVQSMSMENSAELCGKWEKLILKKTENKSDYKKSYL